MFAAVVATAVAVILLLVCGAFSPPGEYQGSGLVIAAFAVAIILWMVWVIS